MRWFRFYIMLFTLLLIACNSTKYVPNGQYLLNRVKITTDNKSVNTETLKSYLRQTPNQSIFGLFRLQLGVYNLSGLDTASRWNKWLKRAGEKPVIFNEGAAQISKKELTKEMINRGYSKVVVQTIEDKHKKKVNITYRIITGNPYKIQNYTMDIQNDSLKSTLSEKKDPFLSSVHSGMNFDINMLDQERVDLTAFLRQHGYANVSKDLFRFSVDTTLQNLNVNAALKLRPDLIANDTLDRKVLTRKRIGRVTFIISATTIDHSQAGVVNSSHEKLDSLWYEGYRFLFNGTKPLFSCISLISNTFIFPNAYYSDKMVEETYSALNSLPPVKYVNVVFRERANDILDCFIMVTPDKNQTFTLDAEGTNSGGNFGMAGDFTYQHRNIFQGAELFKFHARYSYEALGSLSNLFAYNANEFATDVSVKYPMFLFPFLGKDFKQGIRASTTFTIGYNYQIRPEFVRTLANAGIKYTWNHEHVSYSFDLINFSYIYLPRIDSTFKAIYLTNSSPLKYSYENQLIIQSGFNINYNNQRGNKNTKNGLTWRMGISEAGNLLDAACHLLNAKRDVNNEYCIFNLPFAQYVKGDFDVSYNQLVSRTDHLVYHFALGIACPLGNAKIIPYEERYYAGGANGVRGWSSYTLGPGFYPNTNGSIDFVDQTGDINLLANFEYRFKMFWVLEGAAFSDAGNIWTIRNYDFQPQGQFLFSEFYKQIAWSYGVGLRMNFNYFLIRFDLGHKLYNPAADDNNRWVTPFSKPSKSMALFFAIGYPF